MGKYHSALLQMLWVLALAACSAPQPAPPAVEPVVAGQPPAEISTETAAPIATATESPTAVITAAPAPNLCTPLRDIPFRQLPDLVSNPFHPPRSGYDDPHAGLDLAIMLPNSQIAVAGHPVQAVLPGQVAMLIYDRFPFGNGVVIETPLDALPEAWWQPANIPTPGPTLAPRSALTCPAGPEPEITDPNRRSLYILYAHLQEAPALALEEQVGCGRQLGTVGDSGNALNPHLHFEARVAPAGIRMAGMAHYHASVNEAEMRAYCLWSVSDLFQLVDPRLVLSLDP